MKTLGVVILIAGIILGIYSLSIDTSVRVNYNGSSYGMPERVNNLGLMNEKQNYLIVSGVLTLIGLLIVFTSKKGTVTNKSTEQFKETLEKAKIAEYKKDYEAALNFYMETLYHLENDYSNKTLSKKNNDSRLQLIVTLKKKTEEIKSGILK